MDKKFIFFLLLVIVILIVAGIFKYGQETPTTRSTSQQPSSGSSQQPSGSTGDLHPYSAGGTDGSSITIHQTPDGYQIHGRVVYSGNGPPDDTFKELLHNYLISRGISQININNIDVSSREIVDGDENINFQIHCDDCEIIEGYQIDMSIFEGDDCVGNLSTDTNTAILCAYRVAGVLGGSYAEPDNKHQYVFPSPGTDVLKKDGFSVNVANTCAPGFSPVNRCWETGKVGTTEKKIEYDARGLSASIFSRETDYRELCESDKLVSGGRIYRANDVVAGVWTEGPTVSLPDGEPQEGTKYILTGCFPDCIDPGEPPPGIIRDETQSEQWGSGTDNSVFGFNIRYQCDADNGFGPSGMHHAIPCHTNISGKAREGTSRWNTAPGWEWGESCTPNCSPPEPWPEGYVCEDTKLPPTDGGSCPGGEYHPDGWTGERAPNGLACADGFSGRPRTSVCTAESNNRYEINGCTKDCEMDPEQEVRDSESGWEPRMDTGDLTKSWHPFQIDEISLHPGGFHLTVDCKEGYNDQMVGFSACGSGESAHDQNYKLYGCYPTCTNDQECLNLRVEYEYDEHSPSPSFESFKTQLQNTLNENNLDEIQIEPRDDGTSNLTFFRKHISNGKTIIEYQIQCSADQCDIIGEAISTSTGTTESGIDVGDTARFGTRDWRNEQGIQQCEVAQGAEWVGGGRGYQWICENDECNTICDADCLQRGGGQRALPEDVRWNEKIWTPCQIHHDGETFWYGKKGEDGAECPSSCYCPEGTVRIDQDVDISFADMVTTVASWGRRGGQDFPSAAEKQRIMDSWRFQCVPG